jgi:hypothetical protein
MYCKNCRKEAREMVRVPEFVTDSGVFRKRDDPFYLCPVCDHQSLQAILDTHNYFDVDQTKP